MTPETIKTLSTLLGCSASNYECLVRLGLDFQKITGKYRDVLHRFDYDTDCRHIFEAPGRNFAKTDYGGLDYYLPQRICEALKVSRSEVSRWMRLGLLKWVSGSCARGQLIGYLSPKYGLDFRPTPMPPPAPPSEAAMLVVKQFGFKFKRFSPRAVALFYQRLMDANQPEIQQPKIEKRLMYPIPQVARVFGVTDRSVREWVKQRQFRYVERTAPLGEIMIARAAQDYIRQPGEDIFTLPMRSARDVPLVPTYSPRRVMGELGGGQKGVYRTVYECNHCHRFYGFRTKQVNGQTALKGRFNLCECYSTADRVVFQMLGFEELVNTLPSEG